MRGEPLSVPCNTSLNADISRARKDMEKPSMVFFSVFPVLSHEVIKFSFGIHFNQVETASLVNGNKLPGNI